MFNYVSVLALLICRITFTSACEDFCNEHTCDTPLCKMCSVCQDVKDGRHCASFCNVWTADKLLCQGCSMGSLESETATSASCSEEEVVPTVQVSQLGDLLKEPPDLIAAVQRIGLTIPSDWECQARTSSGAWPCPDGVPSQCRWYNFDLARFYNLSSWSTAAASPFLSWADWGGGSNQQIDDMCRKRPMPTDVSTHPSSIR